MSDHDLCIFYTHEGEAVLVFPDGVKYPTAIFPNLNERETVNMFFDTTAGRTLIMQLRSREIHDGLTKLLLRKPARAMIESATSRLVDKKFEGTVSVLVFDLDHFGRLNKTHGQTVGDKVLQFFADMLRRKTRGGDILARWGGEEFVVFAAANKPNEEIGGRDRDKANTQSMKDRISTGSTIMNLDALFHNGRIIADRICKGLRETPCLVGETSIRQTTTVGVASRYITPNCFVDSIFDILFERADLLLRTAKTNGKRDSVHEAPTQMPEVTS